MISRKITRMKDIGFDYRVQDSYNPGNLNCLLVFLLSIFSTKTLVIKQTTSFHHTENNKIKSEE